MMPRNLSIDEIKENSQHKSKELSMPVDLHVRDSHQAGIFLPDIGEKLIDLKLYKSR